MTNIIKFGDFDKLPAHLQALQPEGTEDWGSGQVAGFPVLSLKGKVFHIVRGDEKELITRPDDPDEAASSVHLVVLKTHKGVARTYYAEAYEEGYNESPDCYSNDGVAPSPDAKDPQAKKCAVCPHSQWGSRITDNGSKGKACSEVKRLAVAEPGNEDDPMLLRVPPTSLKNWDGYLRTLGKRGVTPPMVVTKVGFDASVAHQLLTFKPVGFVDAESAERIADMQDNEIVEAIIGHGPAVPVGEDGPEDPEDQPKERKRASRRDLDDEEDEPSPRKTRKPEPEEDDEPAPRRRRRQPEPEEEEEPAPRKRRKPEPEEEDDEPAPRRRRRQPEPEEEDDEPAPRRRRRQPEPEEDDEPAPRKRRAKEEQPELDLEPEEEEKPAAKSAKVEEDDDLESELDDMLSDLGFDDED